MLLLLQGHKCGIWDCPFSPQDRVIATGDRTVKLWSLSDCTSVRTLEGHTSSVLRVRLLLAGGLQVRRERKSIICVNQS